MVLVIRQPGNGCVTSWITPASIWSEFKGLKARFLSCRTVCAICHHWNPQGVVVFCGMSSFSPAIWYVGDHRFRWCDRAQRLLPLSTFAFFFLSNITTLTQSSMWSRCKCIRSRWQSPRCSSTGQTSHVLNAKVWKFEEGWIGEQRLTDPEDSWKAPVKKSKQYLSRIHRACPRHWRAIFYLSSVEQRHKLFSVDITSYNICWQNTFP